MDKQVIERLSSHIENVPAKFRGLTPQARLQHPAPGKWSPQEILGHLIDSAVNNLRRFTEIQFLPQPFTVVGYKQDQLVVVNNYQQLPAEHLLSLWQQLNRQIIYVVENVPAEKLSWPVIIPPAKNETLQWLIVDYVDHMEHHLRQIFGSI
jgi:hypothetical protein